MAAALPLAAALPAHAQERSAGQTYDAQTNWSALNGKIEAAINQNKLIAQTVDNINKDFTKMKACNDKKMIYAPDAAGADADGCAVPTPKLDVTFVSADVCQHFGTVSRVVTCPSGTQVIACSGTPGDQEENGEGSLIQPYGNGCSISIKNQACGKNDKPIQRGWVYASCAKLH